MTQTLTNQIFYAAEAYYFFPQGCKCTDDSGSCDWCRVYYGYDKPWIDEEGRDFSGFVQYCPSCELDCATVPGEGVPNQALRCCAYCGSYTEAI